jgi:hypothetical protein
MDQARSGIDLNRAKIEGELADNQIKQRQINLDPSQLALNEVGVSGNLADQLKKFAATGDYGNGSINVPNMMPDGTRNLANSSVDQYIKPNGWDDKLASDFMRKKAIYEYGIGMGEKDPNNIQKAIGTGNDNRFVSGAGDDPLNYAIRKAGVDGKPEDVQKVQLLAQYINKGTSEEDLNRIARGLLLGGGKDLYNFSKDGVGNVITGDYKANPVVADPSKKANNRVYDKDRGVVVDTATGEVVTPNYAPGSDVAPKINPATNKPYSTKPLPTPALKLQQEELETIGTVAGTNADLDTILGQVKNGGLDLGYFSNMMNDARNFAGMSTEESQNFQTLKSTLERVRNDSLRLNKGVQTDGDAQRAWNELLTNLNDKGVVEARLKDIIGYNKRAVEIRKKKVKNLRLNYNVEPMDFSEWDSADSALGNASTGEGGDSVYVETRTLPDGRVLGKKQDGSVEIISK